MYRINCKTITVAFIPLAHFLHFVFSSSELYNKQFFYFTRIDQSTFFLPTDRIAKFKADYRYKMYTEDPY